MAIQHTTSRCAFLATASALAAGSAVNVAAIVNAVALEVQS